MRSNVFRAWGVLVLCVALCLPRVALAYSAANVGATISRLVLQKASQLGISPGDPRIAATESAMTGEAEALGAAESVASWAAVALAGGLAALVGATPQPLADGSVDQWTVNPDGTLTVTGNPHVAGGSIRSPFGTLGAGAATFWSECTYMGPGCLVSGSMAGVAQAYAQSLSGGAYNVTVDSCQSPEVSGGNCMLHYYDSSTGADSGAQAVKFVEFANTDHPYQGPNCGSGMAWWPGSGAGSCITYAPYSPPVQTQSKVSLATAISSLPASDEALPLAQPLMADVVNTLWNDVSDQSGYDGIPYPATSPVTPGDVATVQSTSPSTYPDVGDLVDPATQPATDLVVPDTGVGTGTGVSTGTGTGASSSSGASGATGTTSDTADLCAQDPGIVACQSLGSATAATLPSSSVTVSLSPVSVGGPSDPVCPAPKAINVFGQTLSIVYDPLCQFVIGLKPLVLALCGLGAALIVVSGLKS